MMETLKNCPNLYLIAQKKRYDALNAMQKTQLFTMYFFLTRKNLQQIIFLTIWVKWYLFLFYFYFIFILF